MTSADRAITKAILAAPDLAHPPPRDGQYHALIVDAGAGRRLAVVTWLAHRGAPSYGEVRAGGGASAAAGLCFATPGRCASATAPSGNRDSVVCDASPFDPADSAWGIYFDAANLDDFVCGLSLDLQREGFGRGSDALAAKLGVGLVYEHVLFHAQVEAGLTWMELQAGHAKFIPYQTRVCTAVRGTDDWLEEALANFWAWSWISADTMLARVTGALTGSQHAALERIVHATLDQSPAGHRRWRDGRQREPWRTLATQAATGKPILPPPGIGLPLEPTLRGPLPFDFRPTDVPLRVLVAGRVATSLLRSPAANSAGRPGKV